MKLACHKKIAEGHETAYQKRKCRRARGAEGKACMSQGSVPRHKGVEGPKLARRKVICLGKKARGCQRPKTCVSQGEVWKGTGVWKLACCKTRYRRARGAESAKLAYRKTRRRKAQGAEDTRLACHKRRCQRALGSESAKLAYCKTRRRRSWGAEDTRLACRKRRCRRAWGAKDTRLACRKRRCQRAWGAESAKLTCCKAIAKGNGCISQGAGVERQSGNILYRLIMWLEMLCLEQGCDW
ncbi:Hypothetical predicted protein [Prunus dulcis]|uniref:Uncharacterized protein n=1 Tax=Prunus dulcis TaxID=3755 RepID=A0A5E4GL86_PRUDU|nr:Hypothetical predicted protein [Prunus dulcis]